jgi:hypothetical protein
MAATRKPRKRSAETELVAAAPAEPLLPATRGKGLVFISHDSRDADLAEAFSNLLTDVSAGVLKSFRASDKRSTTGIAFGAEWYRAIMTQLGEATDVVALLTSQSIERPWILYEAGVAKGKLDTTVLGVALGAPLDMVSTGPFAQFQNCGDDKDSLTKLVMQLLGRNPDTAPREEAVRMQVKMFREKVQGILSVPGKTVETEPTSDAAKLFEEVKEMVRDLPERLEDRVLRSPSRIGGFKGKRRFLPMMLDELLFHPRLREHDSGATAVLVMVSLLRDELPWIYEPGIELYRALRAGSQREIVEARTQLLEVLRATDHPMFVEMLHRDGDEDTFMLLHYRVSLSMR